MARKQKETVDYFPFFVKDGKTLFVLQRKYGLAGIGFFTQVMRMLSQTPKHFYPYVEEFDKDRFNTYCGLGETDVRAMIADMVFTGKLDRELWERRNVIYSERFVDELEEVYRSRSSEAPTKDLIWEETEYLDKETQEKVEKSINPGFTGLNPVKTVSTGFTEQRREEKRREEKTREEVQPAADAAGEVSPMKDPVADVWQDALTTISPVSTWSNVGKERQALTRLGKKTVALMADTGVQDARELIKLILTEYQRARETAKTDYWRHAPFTPSAVETRWSDVVTRVAEAHASRNAEVVF